MNTKINEKFDTALREKILVLSPDALFLYLDSEIAKDASSDVRIKGYRVKVDYEAVPDEEMNRKRDIVAKSIINYLKS